jgi:hypothetical protein
MKILLDENVCLNVAASLRELVPEPSVWMEQRDCFHVRVSAAPFLHQEM